ncbi:MAG TPA: hypothetical protein HPP83_08245, partial [Candidatus Hydrogenedentes bacterium]|nr:hypothetical protein [Candidatus Hydrogenedentota bacterium]
MRLQRLCLVAIAALLYAKAASGQAPDLANMDLVQKSVPDGPVAKVNGVNIGAEEFKALYKGEIALA